MAEVEPGGVEFDPARGFVSTVNRPEGVYRLHFDPDSNNFYKRTYFPLGPHGVVGINNPPDLGIREVVSFVGGMIEVLEEMAESGDPAIDKAGNSFSDARKRMYEMIKADDEEIQRRIDRSSEAKSMLRIFGLTDQ